MCVLAAQQDNETNTANDYNMSEKTNRGRAREEAAEVKPRQVQLDPSEGLSRHSWQSPICPTYFSPPFPHVLAESRLSAPSLDKYSHIPT